MSQSRPSSQSSSNRSGIKPVFQKKIKPRVRGLSNLEEQFNRSTDLNNQTTQGFFSSRSERQIKQKKQTPKNQFYQTASQLSNVNFQNHCSQTCMCGDCSCGRHLCKFNNIKPDLTKNTIYKKDFHKKLSIPAKIVYAKQYEQLDGPHLDMNSTQRTSFIPRQGDKIERPIPEDLLKSHGPSQAVTTYRSLFPGHRGLNQYIKPTDRHTRDNFPLRSKSTYAESFMSKNPKKDNYKYFNDQLKTGGNWYGKTTYGNFFQNPNPQYHAKKVKLIEKLEQNPGFNHQYQTVYKNDFIQKQSAICAAKIHLQTKGRGAFSTSKTNFIQNSDYKAMSPSYQAISTSPFKFV